MSIEQLELDSEISKLRLLLEQAESEYGEADCSEALKKIDVYRFAISVLEGLGGH